MKKLFYKSFLERRNKNTMTKLVSGFTVVEIIIVISIMAVFTAVIYSSFDASKAQSRDQKKVSDIGVLQLALEQYFNKYGVYPPTLNDSTFVPTYIPEIPTDPTNIYNDNYFPFTKITNSPDCVSYQLWTTFERNNLFLGSKKGFNSLSSNLLPDNASGLYYKCNGGVSLGKDASSDPLVYDVMP